MKASLHARPGTHSPPPQITYSRADLLGSMLPTWRRLLRAEGLRVLVYSGDVDAIVPVVSGISYIFFVLLRGVTHV